MSNYINCQLKVEGTTACLEELKSIKIIDYYKIDSRILSNEKTEPLDLSYIEKVYDEEDFLVDNYIDLLENEYPLFEDSELAYEKYNCPFETTEMYYENILNELLCNISLLKNWISNFNEPNIISFKKWFIRYFSSKIDDANYIYFNWSTEFTKFLMSTSLDHLEEDYSIHETGGGFEFFLNKIEFLSCVANTSLEAALFELNEDDGGIFEDED